MKKIICLILALTMVLFAFSSCGKFDVENEDLGAYLKLGDLTTFTYEEICERYEKYREELSTQTVSFYPTTGYTIDFKLLTEVIGEDGSLTTLDAWTKNTDDNCVKGYELFRDGKHIRFDSALAYQVDDISQTSTKQRTVEIGKAVSFTATFAEDSTYTEVAGKQVKFTVTVVKALPAVYTDSDIADRLLSFYNAVSGSKEVIEVGDTVTFNYTGKIDGESFDGSVGSNFVVEVGEGKVWKELEDALVGHKNADRFDVTITFPENAEDAVVAGKEVVFTVVIKDVYNDKTLVQDHTPFADLWELKYALRVQCFAEVVLFDIVLDRSEMISYPEKLLSQFRKMYEGYVKEDISAAIEYYASLGKTYTKAEMKELLYPDGSDVTYVTEASKSATFSYLVAFAARDALNLTYGDKEFEKDLQTLADDYSTFYGEEITPKDILKESGEEVMRMAFLRVAVNEKLCENITGMPEIPQVEETGK